MSKFQFAKRRDPLQGFKKKDVPLTTKLKKKGPLQALGQKKDPLKTFEKKDPLKTLEKKDPLKLFKKEEEQAKTEKEDIAQKQDPLKFFSRTKKANPLEYFKKPAEKSAIQKFAERSVKKEKEVIQDKLLVSIYKSVKRSLRSLFFYSCILIAAAICIALFNIYFAGGSWLQLLYALSKLGVTVVPKIFSNAVRRITGDIKGTLTVKAVITLAEKNTSVRRALNKKVPVTSLKNALGVFGVKIDTEVSIKSILQNVIDAGITVSVSGMSGYLQSFAIEKGVKASIYSVSRARKGLLAIVKQIQKLPNSVSNISQPEQLFKIAERNAVKNEPTKISRRANVTSKKEEASTIREMVQENKVVSVATATSVSLVALAYSSNPTDIAAAFSALISADTETFLSSLNTLTGLTLENDAARRTLFTILTKGLGLDMVLGRLVDTITPSAASRLRQIAEAPLTSENLNEFYGIVLGKKVYTGPELNELTIKELREVARGLNIKGLSVKKDIVKRILELQQKQRQEMVGMVTNFLYNSVKASTVAVAMDYAYENLPLATATEEQIQEALDKARQDRKIQDREQREKVKAEFREKQKSTREERTKTQEIKIEVRRQKILSRVQRRELLNSAKLEAVTRDLGVVIASPEGQSTAVPADHVLLDPRIQKEMKDVEFTPVLQYLTKESLKSSTNWVPGLGWISSVINNSNIALDALETTKDIYKIANVVLQIQGDTSSSAIDIGENKIKVLDDLLQKRVPSLDKVVDELYKTDKVNLNEAMLTTLRDKFVYGWDNRRVAYEIGKKMLGTKESEYAESMVGYVGELFWGKLDE